MHRSSAAAGGHGRHRHGPSHPVGRRDQLLSLSRGAHAVALTTTWSGRQVSSPSTSACARRRVTKTRSAPSTTAWLSVAMVTEAYLVARAADASAFRGDSTITGGSATPSQRPVTIADASAPTPSTPYRSGSKSMGGA